MLYYAFINPYTYALINQLLKLHCILSSTNHLTLHRSKNSTNIKIKTKLNVLHKYNIKKSHNNNKHDGNLSVTILALNILNY